MKCLVLALLLGALIPSATSDAPPHGNQFHKNHEHVAKRQQDPEIPPRPIRHPGDGLQQIHQPAPPLLAPDGWLIPHAQNPFDLPRAPIPSYPCTKVLVRHDFAANNLDQPFVGE